MKVYVCIEESQGEKTVSDVFSSLEVAQSRMRTSYHAYMVSCKIDDNFVPTIMWYKGTMKEWGWYDDSTPNGFYVIERELDAKED